MVDEISTVEAPAPSGALPQEEAEAVAKAKRAEDFRRISEKEAEDAEKKRALAERRSEFEQRALKTPPVRVVTLSTGEAVTVLPLTMGDVMAILPQAGHVVQLLMEAGIGSDANWHANIVGLLYSSARAISTACCLVDYLQAREQGWAYSLTLEDGEAVIMAYTQAVQPEVWKRLFSRIQTGMGKILPALEKKAAVA